ncbi:hypothetical protein X753_17660 [Mesorhizobium sp. LNJC399B00]|nr:hypothetical protein X761_33065 [Mesorhizobium sp. LSHC424B00]ESY04444.1 hypothetical protein X753_17660 [Mesorhizobium sp. LNJC399B00]
MAELDPPVDASMGVFEAAYGPPARADALAAQCLDQRWPRAL